MKITKVFTFDSAHKINLDGTKCENLHGHTYKLEVTVAGKCDEMGMVMDFGLLKEIVDKNVIKILDHHYLNDLFDFNPTSENILNWIWHKIYDLLKTDRVSLYGLRLWETPTSCASMNGED